MGGDGVCYPGVGVDGVVNSVQFRFVVEGRIGEEGLVGLREGVEVLAPAVRGVVVGGSAVFAGGSSDGSRVKSGDSVGG